MKRLFILAAMIVALQACGGSDQGGVVDDGIKDVNLNKPEKPHPETDTAKGEHRADIEQRNK